MYNVEGIEDIYAFSITYHIFIVIENMIPCLNATFVNFLSLF